MNSIRVGAGKACINPPKEAFPLHRYENYYFEGILEDLYTRAIVIDNGTDKFLFLSLDCGNAPYEQLKQEISAHYGIPVENMLTSGIHNHSAPHWYSLGGGRVKDSDEKKAKMKVLEKVIVAGMYKAIDQAIESLRPAKYGFGEGTSYINCNRDKKFEDGFWMQALDPSGFSDKTLAVIKFVDLEGNLIAAFANYCCHATAAFCVYDSDGKGKITCGFPGIACAYIENRYDDKAVVIWSSGAAGDQNPLGTSEGYPRIYEKDGYSESIATPPGTQYMIQRHLGYTHAVDIIAALNAVDCTRTDMRISGTRHTVELQGQKAPEGADMQYNRLLVDNFLRAYRPELFEGGKRPEKKLVEMIPYGVNPLNMELHILGDIALVGAAAELYCQIGAHLKDDSPYRKTIVVTHTGPGAGYILSDEAKDHKVFQSYSKTYHGNNNQPIVNGMQDMFYEVLNK